MTIVKAVKVLRMFWRMRRRLPTFVSVNITNRCTEACPMCAVWRRGEGHELARAELERIFAELQRVGFMVAEISGGEPFLRPDLHEVFALLDRLGFLYTVATNGTLLTPAGIERLRSARGLLQLAVSIDSLDPATYARIRGRNLLPTVLATVDQLAVARLPQPVKVNLVMNRLNYRETLPMLEFARQRGLFLSVFPVNQGEGFLHRHYDVQFDTNEAERQAMAAAFRELARLRRKGEPLWEYSGFYELAADYVLRRPVPPCDAGSLYVDLHADGGFSVCVDQPPLADLRRDDAAAAWRLVEGQAETIRRCVAETPCCYTCTYGVSLTARHLGAYLRETMGVLFRQWGRSPGQLARNASGRKDAD